ncbi:MAG: site-specific integrase, partial [Fulvivirga sp.]
MSWTFQITQFKNYLKLERSLSDNSVQAYIRDIEKLSQFFELKNLDIDPVNVTSHNLQDFIQYVNELGLAPHSQARILSGVKAFYKYLAFEDLIENDPTQLIEGPKLGRKLPDTLDFNEIVSLLEAIDHSTPEGQRNRAMLEVLY